VLIFASLNEVGEDEAAHDFGFTAILAASRALIRLHLCRAAAPFGFMTNWLHHFFWEVGLAHPRSIAGFFSLPDLLRLHFIREHKKPLKDTPIDKHICERAYQHEAIRRVADLRRNLHYLVPAMVDLTGLSAGLTGTAQLVVGPEHTAAFVGSGRIAVLATPVMINVIESAALNAVEHLLPAGHQSLGIHLDVSHVAATPVGLRVNATATVLRVEGRTITFRDEVETIGSGIHQRVVVSVARFDERIQRKVPGQK
jgi:fluoroacetyl-CoA thioesterase